MTTPGGPYDTDDAIEADAAHVYQAGDYDVIQQINAGLLLGALREAGVETGAIDLRIVGQIASRDPEHAQVVIGWIERAYAAGRDQLAGEIAELHARIDAAVTAARRAAPVEVDIDEVRLIVEGRTGR